MTYTIYEKQFKAASKALNEIAAITNYSIENTIAIVAAAYAEDYLKELKAAAESEGTL